MFEAGMAMLEELGCILYKARLPVSDPMYLFSAAPDIPDALSSE